MSEHLPNPTEPEKLGTKTIAEWHTELTGENLDVPCSRYGSNASECAYWAIAAVVIYEAHMGEPEDIEAFADHAMSLVVNDDEEIMHMVLEHQNLLPLSLLQEMTVETGIATSAWTDDEPHRGESS